MKAEFRKSFLKDLKDVSDKSIFKRLEEAIVSLEKTESLAKVANLKN